MIRETSVNVKAKAMARNAYNAAEEYVSSVVAGQPDKDRAAELKQMTPEVVSLAKWMLARREEKAEHFAQLAKTVGDIADRSGFWQRPTFLGKQEYVDQLKALMRRLERSYIEVSS